MENLPASAVAGQSAPTPIWALMSEAIQGEASSYIQDFEISLPLVSEHLREAPR